MRILMSKNLMPPRINQDQNFPMLKFLLHTEEILTLIAMKILI
jgi:hypothetical protein